MNNHPGYPYSQSSKPLFPAYERLQPSDSYESATSSAQRSFQRMHEYTFDRSNQFSPECSNRSFVPDCDRQLQSGSGNSGLNLSGYVHDYLNRNESRHLPSLSRGIISKDYGHQSVGDLKYSKRNLTVDNETAASKDRDFHSFNNYSHSDSDHTFHLERNLSSKFQLDNNAIGMTDDTFSNRLKTHRGYQHNNMIVNKSTFSDFCENKGYKQCFEVTNSNASNFAHQNDLSLNTAESVCAEKDIRQSENSLIEINMLHNILQLNNALSSINEDKISQKQISQVQQKKSFHGDIHDLESVPSSTECIAYSDRQQKILEDRIVSVISKMATDEIMEPIIKSPYKIEPSKNETVSEEFHLKFKEFMSQESRYLQNDSYTSLNKVKKQSCGNFHSVEGSLVNQCGTFDESHPPVHVFRTETSQFHEPTKYNSSLADSLHGKITNSPLSKSSDAYIDRESSNFSVSTRTKNLAGVMLNNISDNTFKLEESKHSAIPFLCETAPEIKQKLNLLQEENLNQNNLARKTDSVESIQKKSYLEDAIDVLIEKEPIIGLEYITEYKNLVSMKGSFPFFCKICNSSIARMSAVDHVIGSKHRLKCLKFKDETLYKEILSIKGQSKEKENMIRKAAETVEAIYGRGQVIVEIKDVKKTAETPCEENTIDDQEKLSASSSLPVDLPAHLIKAESSGDSYSNSKSSLFENDHVATKKDNSFNPISDSDTFKITSVENPVFKRSTTFDDKTNKFLKTENEFTASSEGEKIKIENSEDKSNYVDKISEDTLDMNSTPHSKSSAIENTGNDAVSTEVQDAKNIYLPNFIEYLSKYEISSEEEAGFLMNTVGVILKSLLQYKLKTLKCSDSKHLLDYFSKPSPEAFEKLISFLRKLSTNGEEKELDENVINNDINESESKCVSDRQHSENISNKNPILISEKECSGSSNVCEGTNTIKDTQAVVPASVSQNSGHVNLAPPPFFSWSKSNNSSLVNVQTVFSPTTMQSSSNWNPSYQVMPMPNPPYFLQPAVGMQGYSNSGQFTPYGIPTSKINSPGLNNFPTSTSVLPPPPPPILPTASQYSIPISDKPLLNKIPPPPPPLPPFLPPPPPLPTQ